MWIYTNSQLIKCDGFKICEEKNNGTYKIIGWKHVSDGTVSFDLGIYKTHDEARRIMTQLYKTILSNVKGFVMP